MYADSPRARNIDRSLRDQRRSRFGSFRVSVVVARPPSAERVVLISRANRVELFRLAKEPTASMQASTALQLIGRLDRLDASLLNPRGGSRQGGLFALVSVKGVGHPITNESERSEKGEPRRQG